MGWNMSNFKYRLWDANEQKMYFPGQSKHRYSSNAAGVDVMLYLNHLDANGVEIYEHDIVKVRYAHHPKVAYFVASVCNPVLDYATALVTQPRPWAWEACEVVGNIHENEEMLAFVM